MWLRQSRREKKEMTTQFTHPPPGTWNARNLLTVSEVAEWARVHPKTVYRWIKDGKDEIVQPNQVIVVPGYFLRYIPLLGLELAWLYIGFRKAAYEAGAAKNPGKKFGAPSKKVARYLGMSMRTF
jgi:hypothetical protein